MPDDFYPICIVIFLTVGVMIFTVRFLERRLAKAAQLPPPLKVKKIKKQRYEPLPPLGKRTYPDGREEVISREIPDKSKKI